MNFVYLSKKYLGVDCLMEDRTYGGLLWPSGAGEKPSYETFESFQREEDRLGRVDKNTATRVAEERRLEHRRVHAKALEDIVPLEEKIKAEHDELRKQTIEQRRQAVELQHSLETRNHVEHTWKEIAAADDRVTKEAQQYLEDTAKYLSWDPHKVPAEILANRERAHNRIDAGKTVYANWQALRASEMPTREEMAEAIRAGGEQLERLKKICSEISLRYPKPRKNHY